MRTVGQASLFSIMVSLLTACGLYQDVNGLPGCTRSQQNIHRQRLSAFQNNARSMDLYQAREPIDFGKSFVPQEIKAVLLSSFGTGYGSNIAYIYRDESKTRVYGSSDLRGGCFDGQAVFEYNFPPESLKSLDTALATTQRVTLDLPACTSSLPFNSQGLVKIFFRDSTSSSYLADNGEACPSPESKDLPMISGEFFQEEAKIRKNLQDFANPYPAR